MIRSVATRFRRLENNASVSQRPSMTTSNNLEQKLIHILAGIRRQAKESATAHNRQQVESEPDGLLASKQHDKLARQHLLVFPILSPKSQSTIGFVTIGMYYWRNRSTIELELGMSEITGIGFIAAVLRPAGANKSPEVLTAAADTIAPHNVGLRGKSLIASPLARLPKVEFQHYRLLRKTIFDLSVS
eukprot:IDg11821t1